MGSGSWTTASYSAYSCSVGRTVSLDGTLNLDTSNAQEVYREDGLNSVLNPYNVVRECRDSEEHPNTFPVILALDVTGSMGHSAIEVAKKLNVVMTELYDSIPDVQFMTMGIGDLAYDEAPIQASQFESDVRIAEQLDKIYFEGNGGGNAYESYTAAWYFGTNHTDLDCWKRGKKGIIITMGDEPLNPYLPARGLKKVLGDDLQGDVETQDLYEEVSEKFELYHIVVENYTSKRYASSIKESYGKYLGGQHLIYSTVEDISQKIIDIVKKEYFSDTQSFVPFISKMSEKGISW